MVAQRFDLSASNGFRKILSDRCGIEVPDILARYPGRVNLAIPE